MNAELIRRILDTATCQELIRLLQMVDAEIAHRCEACRRACVIQEKKTPTAPES